MIGRRSFAVTWPSLSDTLPAALWRPEMTLHTFKWQLKAYLFHIWCVDEQKEDPTPPGAVVAFFVILAPNTKLPTYLLTYTQFWTYPLESSTGYTRQTLVWMAVAHTDYRLKSALQTYSLKYLLTYLLTYLQGLQRFKNRTPKILTLWLPSAEP